MMEDHKFTLTEDHIKLARRMQVGYDEYTEFGAPEIDPKRPYGNSAVENDMHEILTGETIGLIDSNRDELNRDEESHYQSLHREMETALQIILAAGTFEPGEYRAPAYSTRWVGN